MNIKKIIYFLLLVIFISGCSNVKELGTDLNKKESIENKIKIKYLHRQFTDIKVGFLGRNQGQTNCECDVPFLDASCLSYKCDDVPGKYLWKYKICSNKTDLFCTDANYNEVTESWYITYEEDFKFANIVLDILEENNVTYSTFTSDGNTHYFIMIKKDDSNDNLINAVRKTFEEFESTGSDGDGIQVSMFNEDDYDYILNNLEDEKGVYGDYTLYELLNPNNRFGILLEKKELDDDEMFNCSTNDYEHVAYNFYYPSNQIWCDGV